MKSVWPWSSESIWRTYIVTEIFLADINTGTSSCEDKSKETHHGVCLQMGYENSLGLVGPLDVKKFDITTVVSTKIT